MIKNGIIKTKMKLIGIILVSLFILLNPSPSYAIFGGCTCCCTSCAINISSCSSACACTSTQETGKDIPHITSEFIFHREWLITVFWQGHILPALMLMTEQMTTVAVQQTLAIGMLFDAKHQLESQRLLQELQAQAHKDYHPSEGLCEFGTNVRSLAASDRNAEFNKLALSKRAMERQLMTGDTISTGTNISDSDSRWVQFKQVYCNPQDDNNGLTNLCTGNKPHRHNRDLNYSALIDGKRTLQIDFTTDADSDHTPRGATEDEEDVLSLMNNLYGSKISRKLTDINFMSDINGVPIDAGSFLYMDTRAIAAKRNVALSAGVTGAGLKSQGEATVQPYMKAMFEEMGVSPTDADEILGPRPSYDSQMKFLTQNLYHYDFFTDLYDKPVNVDRKNTAMLAISSMQKRDMYKSLLRSEMIQSLWLETSLKLIEDKYINNAGAPTQGKLLTELQGALP